MRESFPNRFRRESRPQLKVAAQGAKRITEKTEKTEETESFLAYFRLFRLFRFFRNPLRPPEQSHMEICHMLYFIFLHMPVHFLGAAGAEEGLALLYSLMKSSVISETGAAHTKRLLPSAT